MNTFLKMADRKIENGGIITDAGNSARLGKGIGKKFKVSIDLSVCNKCGRCWMYCPDSVFKKNESGNFEAVVEHCKGCGLCIEVCPLKCITLEEVKE